MFPKKTLPFIKYFLERINQGIDKHQPGAKLSALQQLWIGFCLMGIVVTNSICWYKFQRASISVYKAPALSWMFRKAAIPWNFLLQVSVCVILEEYNINRGVLALDETNNKRAKNTSNIYLAHKIKDKKTNGYINGQSIVFLLLVTPLATIPVGFEFYMPDPQLTAWNKEDRRLKKLKVPSRQRPRKPERNPLYPTKHRIALNLLARFKKQHPDIYIKLVVADALYGNSAFVNEAQSIFGTQVISQLRRDQKLTFQNKELTLDQYFGQRNLAVVQSIQIRGHKQVQALVSSARIWVNAHKKKRFVIALKYPGETDFRYLVASDMSWRTIDIIEGYTLRWLVEVFFEDWKLYEGWGQLTKQPGEDGARRSLLLSLLLDHCLLLHPAQKARIEGKLPACTVGSLRDRVRMECLLASIEQFFGTEERQKSLQQLAQSIEQSFPLAPSKKHFSGREFGDLEPAPSLKYRAERALAAPSPSSVLLDKAS